MEGGETRGTGGIGSKGDGRGLKGGKGGGRGLKGTFYRQELVPKGVWSVMALFLIITVRFLRSLAIYSLY